MTWESGAEWLRGEGDANDVVVSSRVRLARNLSAFPFTHRANQEQRLQVLAVAKDQILNKGVAERVMWIDLHDAPKLDRLLLVERQLISKQHARGKAKGGEEMPRGVAVSMPGERLSIMVNEEDHLRIQSIRSGLALDEALAETDQVDDRLEEGLDYAFSERFGYITACPTNVGTGVRFSAMLHLPGLVMSGEIDKVKQAANDMSLAVRGLHGEGSEAAGDLFQISNQTTLGRSEQALLRVLKDKILPQVIEYERTCREKLSRSGRLVEDQIHRARGTLLHARLLSFEEAMGALSKLRLGVMLGIFGDIDLRAINQLMLLAQPAHLQRVCARDLPQGERRAARADMLRRRLGDATS